MSKRKRNKGVKIPLYIYMKNGNRVRMDKLPVIYNLHVENLMEIVSEDTDVDNFKTLYVPEEQYLEVLKELNLETDEYWKGNAKVDVKDDIGNIRYMIRSRILRDKDMESLAKSGELIEEKRSQLQKIREEQKDAGK